MKKVDIGKEAILRAAAALTARDEFGVVAFDQAAHWIVKTAPLGGGDRPAGRDRRHQARRPDEHLRGPRPGGAVAQERDRDPAPHHPAHRRLVQQRPVRRHPQADEGRRDHALHGRRGRRREPVPRAARPATAAAASTTPANPSNHPRHLPQGDPAGLGPADRRGEVLPDPDLVVADPARASRAACRRCWATTARPPSPPRRPCSSRRATTRSSRSGSTASAGRWPGPRTRPAAGRRAGSAGPGSRQFFSQMVGWTFPGEESGGIEASFVDRGGRTYLRVESVDEDGSPRDFYATHVALVGPDLPPADRRPVPDRAGRVRDADGRRSTAARTRSG